MNRLLSALTLPSVITEFEERYLDRINYIGLLFFALHVPVLMTVAYFNETGALFALALSLGVLSGPALAYYTVSNPRTVSVSHGFTAMLMGGLLVHFGQGPLQIEMHFYFFALLAMLALYGNPMVILVAAVTVAVHHLLLWLLLPASVFNYAASIWVVAVHAGFVVLESVGAIFISRSFFENVIGLEKIVNERTRALDTRNRDLRLVLDHVEQGLVTIGLDGVMSKERSLAVDRWLGAVREGTTLAQHLSSASPEVGEHCEGAWEQVASGALIPELSLDQMPKRVVARGRYLDIAYTPILKEDELQQVLVVFSDVTSDVERERLQAEQRETLHIFDRVMRDRAGFFEFFRESERHVSAIVGDLVADEAVLKRVLHTLKGNAGLFRIQTIVEACHAMETRLVEAGERPSPERRDALAKRWSAIAAGLDALLGERAQGRVELDDSEYNSMLAAIRNKLPHDQIVRGMESWRLESTRRRLQRIAEQAQGIAERLGKPCVDVVVSHGDLRLDAPYWAPFWSGFVHVVRNALDHGIEGAEERRQQGKAEHGKLTLTTRLARDELVIEVEDDGRGVDWQAIGIRARERGLPFGSEAELAEALFSDGISTKLTANEYSGRGIGMGAARDACRERKGSMLVHSSHGRGTRIEFRFPINQMVETATARLVA